MSYLSNVSPVQGHYVFIVHPSKGSYYTPILKATTFAHQDLILKPFFLTLYIFHDTRTNKSKCALPARGVHRELLHDLSSGKAIDRVMI